MKLRASLAGLALATFAAAQERSPEEYAEELLGARAVAELDAAGCLAAWLELLESDPAHPLGEVPLRFVRVELEGVADLVGLRARLLRIDPTRLAPGALREWELLRGWLDRRLTPEPLAFASGEVDLFPAYWREFRAIGPFGPLDDPLGLERAAELLSTLDWGDGAAGLDGRRLAWRSAQRYGLEPTIEPDRAASTMRGLVVLAAGIESRSSGEGWLEIDTGFSTGTHALSAASARGQGWSGSVVDPSFVVSWNCEPAVHVDRLRQRERDLVRLPVHLAAGVNRVALVVFAAARTNFAVRVLDEQGRPWRELAPADPALGAVRAAPLAPRAPLRDAAELLSDAAHASDPWVQALLGRWELLDRRPAEALAALERALALAPDRAEFSALLAVDLGRMPHVPEPWSKRRRRELAERALELDPTRVDAAAIVASALAGEDREEQAIELLESAATHAADPTAILLELMGVYAELELTLQSERALERALAIEPPSPIALGRAAQRAWRSHRPEEALRLAQRRADLVGRDAEEYRTLASRLRELGRADESLRAAERAAALDPSLGGDLAWVATLETAKEYERADRELAAIAAAWPELAEPWARRADLARRREDRAAERAALGEALEREASNPVLRRRLSLLSANEEPGAEAQRLLERSRALTESALASYDRERWNESAVRVIDAAWVEVFDDGGQEQVTHTLLHLCDLEACEAYGTQTPAGEVLRIVTLKGATGEAIEPVRTDEGYVMPNLEPGDFVEIVSRAGEPPPEDGRVDAGQWRFASDDEVFHLSRYEIAISKRQTLELVEHRFAGTHEVREEAARVVHVFEARDSARIEPEAYAPPAETWLPWVHFAEPVDRRATEGQIRALAWLSTAVDPAIRAAAARATAGVDGDEARARALHAFVGQALDKLGSGLVSASAALCEREGNPTWLFAALLAASDIPHDVVWSRGIAADAELERDPPFVDASHWLGQALVRVEPRDGPVAWCDLSLRTLPYACGSPAAPRATAFSTRDRRWIELPDVPLTQRGGFHFDLVVRVAADRSAQVELVLELKGLAPFYAKESFRGASKAQRKRALAQLGAQVVPGLELAEWDLVDLDHAERPLVYRLHGKVRAFLDESGELLTSRLPFPALDLEAGLGGGERARRLEFFLPEPVVQTVRARLELAEELELVEAPESSAASFEGGTHRLSVERIDSRTLSIERDLLLPPMRLAPERHGALMDFARRIDQAERARLAWRRR